MSGHMHVNGTVRGVRQNAEILDKESHMSTRSILWTAGIALAVVVAYQKYAPASIKA